MTRIKSIGESRSPWCSPLLCEMKSPGTPFSIICVEEVASNPLIISHQLVPKPNFLMTSRRKAQETESNAFEMSSLRSKQGYFCWWRNRAVCCTNIKLSWMNRFLMKADRFRDTITCILPTNILAKTLVTSLVKLSTKPMGLKSLTHLAGCTLGKRVMNAEFNPPMFLNFRAHTQDIAAITSFLMIGQQDL
jgi:hypothetical protein